MGRFKDNFAAAVVKDKELSGYLKIFDILKKKIKFKYKGLSKIHFRVKRPRVNDFRLKLGLV